MASSPLEHIDMTTLRRYKRVPAMQVNHMWTLMIVLMTCSCGAPRAVVVEGPEKAENTAPTKSEQVFEPRAQDLWIEPPIIAAGKLPATDFDVLSESYGEGIASVDLLPGAKLHFGANDEIASCELRSISVVGAQDDRLQLYVHSEGFAWYPTVAPDELEPELILEDTVVYTEDGIPFALMDRGARARTKRELDDNWVQVCVTEDCTIEGIIRAGRRGRLAMASDVEQTWHFEHEDVKVEPAEFALLDASGDVLVDAVHAERLWVISKSDEWVEVAFGLPPSAHDSNPITLTGFVARETFDAMLVEEELGGMMGFGMSGRAKEFAEPIGYQEPGSWVYASRDEESPFAQAMIYAKVSILERGDTWAKISVETSWGRMEGFSKIATIVTDAPEPQSYAIQGGLIPDECVAQ